MADLKLFHFQGRQCQPLNRGHPVRETRRGRAREHDQQRTWAGCIYAALFVLIQLSE